ncbi:hypothetical protein A3J34_03780 [Candidatus Peribacteria bacterium RIFCSPLOWO2_02_FULL_51_10]|nr:MAG: hypothetical protein A3C52_01640 [Candidatus Peribacteria bacterium RIFCSPHIGHO2_02_FULL_51_15]OGJ68146.1 MAG: hypothetical protein A3J34_03780 [Candidatus Peribacteria bacterium RIFCSPLOWO2_02_FULL_51_10]
MFLFRERNQIPLPIKPFWRLKAMTRGVTTLKWLDVTIPHVLTVREWEGGVRLQFQIVKDGGTQVLPPIDLPKPVENVAEAWTGQFTEVLTAVQSAHLYVQGRVLLRFPDGCIYWSVNHWKASDGKTRSIDCWGFMPGMTTDKLEFLVPIK